MAIIEKIMHFANFNITFGKEEEPMLVHFMDIIYPAFISGFRRGNSETETRFYLTGVEVKKFVDEYVLVGNYIKDTQYNVYTTFQEGKLVSTPSSVPTAPYSRFIIFLKNHRMILVRNENQSPDIRSFQAMVRSMLNHYIAGKNRKKANKNKLPHALVNIVDVPLPNDIKTILKDVKKIKSLQLRFFPLNNDISPIPIFDDINKQMKAIRSERANIKFVSPESKEEVENLMVCSSGLAAATLEVESENGNISKIREDQFSSTTKVPFSGDLKPEDDEYLIAKAKQEHVVSITSTDNIRLYNRFKDTIMRLLS